MLVSLPIEKISLRSDARARASPRARRDVQRLLRGRLQPLLKLHLRDAGNLPIHRILEALSERLLPLPRL